MIETMTGLQLACTLAMVGVIWYVQLVHYPLFSFVDPRRFAPFERAHQRATTLIVAPLMIGEALLSFAWLWVRPASVSLVAAAAGLMLVLGIWLSTFLLQVPAHKRLSCGYDAGVHRFLVLSNWARTLPWTVRGALLLWITY